MTNETPATFDELAQLFEAVYEKPVEIFRTLLGDAPKLALVRKVDAG